jgi:hypothetical protein
MQMCTRRPKSSSMHLVTTQMITRSSLCQMHTSSLLQSTDLCECIFVQRNTFHVCASLSSLMQRCVCKLWLCRLFSLLLCKWRLQQGITPWSVHVFACKFAARAAAFVCSLAGWLYSIWRKASDVFVKPLCITSHRALFEQWNWNFLHLDRE